MIVIRREIIINAVQELEVKDQKEYSNIVGNAMKGHGQFALKVLMNHDKFTLSEDQIYDEIWDMFETGEIDEKMHSQFINDLRHNPKGAEMIGRYLRKAKKIIIR